MRLDNTIGTGDFFDYNQHLIFNNYSPSTLVSVLVFSDGLKNIEQLNLEIVMEIYYRTHQYLYQMAQMVLEFI